MNQYIHYGCGLSAPVGWRNFDASPTVRFERLPVIGRLYTKNHTRFPPNVEYGDITRGLPIEVESCDAVYCSHVLEHLTLEGFRLALRHTYKILRPGGTFRFVLPDLEYAVRQYLNNPARDAAISFIRESGLGWERRSVAELIASWLGNARHRWLWDYKAIQLELEEAGFVSIRRAAYGDNDDPLFRDVEEQHRWRNALGVECRRPVGRDSGGDPAKRVS